MAANDDIASTWSDDDTPGGPRAGETHEHHTSGLMPAQDDAALEEIAPEQVADRDAFGRSRDER